MIDRSSSIPSIVLTASSIGRVTCVSISSTLAPRRVVVTKTNGRSSFGWRSTPEPAYETMPSTIGRAQSIVVKTGRRMQTDDSVIAAGPSRRAGGWDPSSLIEAPGAVKEPAPTIRRGRSEDQRLSELTTSPPGSSPRPARSRRGSSP